MPDTTMVVRQAREIEKLKAENERLKGQVSAFEDMSFVAALDLATVTTVRGELNSAFGILERWTKDRLASTSLSNALAVIDTAWKAEKASE